MALKAKITRADFAQLAHKKGLRIHGTFFSLTAFPPQARKVATWTCIVSKGVAQKAHDRNRIKRVCREAARVHARKQSLSYALVFRAKKESRSATFKEVDADIQFLFKKLSEQGSTAPQ